MNWRVMLIGWFLAWCLCAFGQDDRPPQRLLYFADSGRSFSALDPGEEILRRNLLISNQASGYNVSFALSFNKDSWSGYALGPRYSSIFSMDGQEGCYIRIQTQSGAPDSVSEVI
ncbi:MAG: hypothetical protein AAGJ93_12860, partial [Bacteroidota bacterium]